MGTWIAGKILNFKRSRLFDRYFRRLVTFGGMQLFAVAAFLTSCTLARPGSRGDDRESLLQLEREWLNLEYSGDTTALSALLDSGYVSITPTETLKKHEFLSHVAKNFKFRKDKGIKIDSFKLERPLFKVYSNTAIVIFTERFYANKNGEKIEGTEQFYDVWWKRNGKWLAVSSQKHY
jgi:hypothetical protein